MKNMKSHKTVKIMDLDGDYFQPPFLLRLPRQVVLKTLNQQQKWINHEKWLSKTSFIGNSRWDTTIKRAKVLQSLMRPNCNRTFRSGLHSIWEFFGKCCYYPSFTSSLHSMQLSHYVVLCIKSVNLGKQVKFQVNFEFSSS